MPLPKKGPLHIKTLMAHEDDNLLLFPLVLLLSLEFLDLLQKLQKLKEVVGECENDDDEVDASSDRENHQEGDDEVVFVEKVHDEKGLLLQHDLDLLDEGIGLQQFEIDASDSCKGDVLGVEGELFRLVNGVLVKDDAEELLNQRGPCRKHEAFFSKLQVGRRVDSVVVDEAFVVLLVDIFRPEIVLKCSFLPALERHDHVLLLAEQLHVREVLLADFVESEAFEVERGLDLVVLFVKGQVVLLVVHLEEVHVDVPSVGQLEYNEDQVEEEEQEQSHGEEANEFQRNNMFQDMGAGF